jgi:hypothetical protein
MTDRSEEESVARGAQRQNGARTRTQRRPRHDNDGIIPVLARVVREVESAVQHGRAVPSTRTKFQVVALLMREERARVKTDETTSAARRTEELKRLDGIATILATTAARDSSLLGLLADDAVISDRARSLRRELLLAAGMEAPEEPVAPPEPAEPTAAEQRRVVPRSVVSRQLANPFLAPDYSAVARATAKPRRLAGWELIGPLLRSFEEGGTLSCMHLPEPVRPQGAGGLELMPHQASLVAPRRRGTGRSCSPTSPAWARRHRRCWPPRRRTPTRCSSSCRTS